MNILLVLLSLVAVVTLLVLQARGFRAAPRVLRLANLGVSEHVGALTRKADAAHASRYLLVKVGTDGDHVAIAGAADIPYGVCTDRPLAAEDPAAVELFGCSDKTKTGISSAAIAVGAFIVPAADGKVRTLPVGAGTYYIIGRAMTPTGGADEEIEYDPYPAIQRVVT